MPRACGGRGGRFGRGGGRSRSQAADNAMASTYVNASQRELLDTIERLPMQLAASQAGSSNALSAQARGVYLKLHALILDSGCSKHTTPNRDMFTTYTKLAVPRVVKFGGGTVAQSVEIGTFMIMRPDDTPLNLKWVLHVPDLVATLLSV